MKTVAVLIPVFVIAACQAEERCTNSSARYWDQALSRQLAKNDVRHVMRPPNNVCFSTADAKRVEAATREVDNFFPEVAALLKDACEERAYVEWATAAGLLFEVGAAKDSAGNPGGRLFMLRSLTKEDVPINRQRLSNEAPGGKTCKS